MSEKTQSVALDLDLDLPEASDFLSLPPRLSLDEYTTWCEEYWLLRPGDADDVPVAREEFVM